MTRAAHWLVAALAVVAGCGSSRGITRVVDDVTEDGRSIEPEAYAAYLRGALAEEDGRVDEALAAYDAAAKADVADVDIRVRRARILCARSPRDAEAEIARALAEDPRYAPAHAARAACLARAGAATAAAGAADKARAFDPHRGDYEWTLPSSSDGDARILAATLAFGERSGAWEALAQWASRHGRPALHARALEGMLARAPARRADVAEAASALAGRGELALARRVALAALSAEGPRPSSTATLLGLDAALTSSDASRAGAVAVRAHVPREEAAARALLLGNRALARELVADVLAAEPGNAGARAVALALGSPHRGEAAPPRPLGAASFIALARALLSSSPEVAVAWASAATHEPVPFGDALLVPLAVDLAARGVAVELPADGAVELAARRGAARPNVDRAALAPRHALLFDVLGGDAASARKLSGPLSGAVGRDPVVTAAIARHDPAAAAALFEPSQKNLHDALALAPAIRAAESGGVAAARIEPSRRALCRVAVTEPERSACSSTR